MQIFPVKFQMYCIGNDASYAPFTLYATQFPTPYATHLNVCDKCHATRSHEQLFETPHIGKQTAYAPSTLYATNSHTVCDICNVCDKCHATRARTNNHLRPKHA